MALAKPEVKPTSPAVFGDNWFFIHFFYKQDLSNKQAEVKLFDINNTLIEPENDDEWLFFVQFDIVEDKNNLYSALFDWDGFNMLTNGQFYKASIRIIDTDSKETSPWSNLTIFKQTSLPTVVRKNWGEEKDFFFNDSIVYSLEDRTELLERVEYQYIIYNNDDNTAWQSPMEEIAINDLYNEEYEYNIKLKSVVDYAFVREYSDIRLYIGLKAIFYTKNGYYTKEWMSSDDTIEMRIEPEGLLKKYEVENQYGNVMLKVDTDGAPLYRIYNKDQLILESKNDSDNYIDCFAEYVNNYSIFALKNDAFGDYLATDLNYRAYCDFDSVFLIDAKENTQLNITLNNSVNSFKCNILETKTDTVGSQYPVFFRNPNAKYREFPLSGTISYHSLVSFGKEYGIDFSLPEMPHKNLTTDNLYAERIFREKVIDFLTKDRPLLYKSQTEGNIVVKLMNIQLTPNKTLGRMIYDFSCTCYEVQDLQSYMKERWE